MRKTAVVILNWNGLSYLKRYLAGVVSNSMGDCAVYVADNGSADGSAEWVSETFSDVNIIRFKKNLGYSGGYATALKQIDAEYYVLLNSDVEVTGNWLDPLVSYMDEHPGTAACQPKILSAVNRGLFEYAGAAGGFIDRYGYPFCRGRIFGVTEEDTGQYDSVVPVFWASGACIMVRASAYHQTGGLDPSFFAHMEEIDLCWRMHLAGYNIVCIPQSVVYHVGGGTLVYGSPEKTYLNFRNNLYMLHKNLPEGKLHHILFIRRLLDGLAAIVFLLKLKPRHFNAVLRAHRDYRKASGVLNSIRGEIVRYEGRETYPADVVLNKSILRLFYLRRIRRFSDIAL
jgi:GT2 family glycosyltransferase